MRTTDAIKDRHWTHLGDHSVQRNLRKYSNFQKKKKRATKECMVNILKKTIEVIVAYFKHWEKDQFGA